MATYNSVSFGIREENSRHTRWRREAKYASLPVPFADYDVLQYCGRGNPVLRVTARVDSDSDYATLEASADGTARTLTNPFGDSVNYANVVLRDVGEPEYLRGGKWLVALTFEQKGS